MNRVRELRKSKGMSQKELAETVGLEQANLSRKESGQGSFSAQQIQDIADALGVSAGELLGDPVRNNEDRRAALLAASQLYSGIGASTSLITEVAEVFETWLTREESK